MSDDPRPRERPPLFTRNVVRLLVGQACFGYAFSSFFMLPKFLVTELGAGPVEIGWISLAYGTAVIVCLPAVGVFADRIGRKVFVFWGSSLMVAAALAFVAVTEVGALAYGLRAIQGIAFAMAFVGASTIAVSEAPRERLGQAIALFGLSMLAMNGVAAAGVEAISTAAGWPAAFVAAAAAAAVCALLSRGLDEGEIVPHADGNASLWQVLSRPSLVPMWIAITCIGAAMSSMVTYHQPFAISLGIETVSGFFVAYAAGSILVRVGLGHFIDRAGRRRVAIGSAIFYVGVVASMSQLGSAAGLAWMGIGLGIAHGFFFPASNSLAVDSAASDERGKVMALFQSGFHLGFAGSAVAFGWLADAYGYPPVFYTGGACAAVALVVMLGSRARPAPATVLADELPSFPARSRGCA